LFLGAGRFPGCEAIYQLFTCEVAVISPFYTGGLEAIKLAFAGKSGPATSSSTFMFATSLF
jgi:hypothetical protein